MRLDKLLAEQILELIDTQTHKLLGAVQDGRIVLGGSAGSAGGIGGPPIGFWGQLTQSNVTYDTAGSRPCASGSAGSDSLVDNLDRIRLGWEICDDAITEDHIDWGLGAGQISAVDVPFQSTSGSIDATNVRDAIEETYAEGGGGVGVSDLDEAYDGGRIITADAGAVEIQDSGGLLLEGNLILDDGVGDSPQIQLISGSDDTAIVFLEDVAGAGESDLIIKLPGGYYDDSRLIIRDVDNNTRFTFASYGTFTADIFVGGQLQVSSGVLLAGVADALVLDLDGDTTISAPTDDQIDFEAGGVDICRIDGAGLLMATGKVVDLNGNTDGLILDADGDSAIASPNDDQIRFKVGGNNVVQIDDTGLTLMGANDKVVDLNGSVNGLILDNDMDTTISAPTDDQIDFEAGGADRMTLTASGLALAAGGRVNEFSTDGTLAGNSDLAVPTEKAVKTYVDSRLDPISPFLALPMLRGLWVGSVSSTGAWYDFSQHNLHLTYNGNPQHNYDGLAPYWDYDGAGDYHSHADDAELDILGTESYVASSARGLTLGGWFYPGSAPAGQMIGKANDTNGPYFLWTDGNSILFRIRDAGDANNFSVSLVTTPNNWQFVVGRYTPSTEIKIWRNTTTNTNVAGIPASILDGADSFGIGAHGNGNSPYTGRASLCFLCAAVLSDAIIDSLLQKTRALYGV